MPQPRTCLLNDPSASPPSWNDRMIPGEFAVLYTSAYGGALMNPDGSLCVNPDKGLCTIFSSLEEAEQHCASQLIAHPTLRLTIFDHHGRGKPAVREFFHPAHAPKGDFTSRTRRWLGVTLFGGALILGTAELISGFSIGWAGMFAMGIGPAGLMCLLSELISWYEVRRNRKKTLTAN